MEHKTLVSIAALATLVIVDATVLNVAQAFFGNNMMNPGRWFDNDDDYYDRGHRYGGYGPYGYGGPYGGYGPYGYGGYPGYGGGYPGYGGGYPGYGGGYPSTIVVNPSGNTNRAPAPPPPPRLPE